MCKKRRGSQTFDPENQIELTFGVTNDELKDLMQSRGKEVSDKVKSMYGSVENIASKLNTDLVNGISGDQELLTRQTAFGKNEIPPKPPTPFFKFVLKALSDKTLIILIVCAVVSIGLSFYHPPDDDTLEEYSNLTKEYNVEWIEGVAIFVAVIVVVLVGSLNDWNKERKFRGLQNRIEKENVASVVRNGKVIQINMKDLVVGDICCIKYGDTLSADGLVVKSSDLKIDESSLTGETDLIKKNDTDNIYLLSGTNVMEGSGTYLVTAVGLNSQTGIIFTLCGATAGNKKKSKKEKKSDKKSQKELSTNEEKEELKDQKEDKKGEKSSKLSYSVLQLKLNKLSSQIGYAGMAAALITFILLVLRMCIDEFVIKKHHWSNTYIKYILSYLVQAVTVVVVSVPEGLPLAVTLSLAYAIQQMTKDNNLVKHLYACETMGSATTICSDKTGTLTTNRMTVVQCFIGGEFFKKVPQKESVSNPIRNLIYESISINTNYASNVEPPKEAGELPKQIGNKTECGLLGFVTQLGGSYDAIRTANPIESFVKVYTFNSARKMMSTIIELPNKSGYRLFTKGASEIVLFKCSYILNADGIPIPLSKPKAQEIVTNIVEAMAMEGLRTITVAYRDFVPKSKANRGGNDQNVTYYDEVPDWDNDESVVSNLTCVCLVGIEDPVRDEVPDAIRKCQRSGVVVRMVTGDNINTATSIATKCGIVKPGDDFLILESKDFNSRIRDASGEVSQKLFDEVWPHLRVLARSSPQDKYTLINGIVESKLSANREVVAVTGDGTNDAPALKRADVGFAMGIQGTDVAKEASDIILTDDNFSSILKALMWGRNVYDSIAKFLQFQLTANFVAALLSIICAATIRSVPLKAVQMLWVNLVMDTLASLALATEKPTDSLLNRKPYGRTKPILSISIIKNVVGHGIYQLVIIVLCIYFIEPWFGIDDVVKYGNLDKLKAPSQHFTFIFNAFVLMTLFNEINARKLHGEHNVFEGIHKNPYFYVIWIVCFAGQIIIVTFGDHVFSTVHLNIEHWGWCLLFGVGSLLWGQLLTSLPTSFIKRLLCKKKKAEEEEEEIQQEIQELEELNQKNIDELSEPTGLWIRGIGRIQQQLRVVSSFQSQLEEVRKHRGMLKKYDSLELNN